MTNAALSLGGAADMTAPLAGQVAIVTGASRGLGATIADGLARDGAFVDVWYRRSRRDAMNVVDRITESGGFARATAVDVTARVEIEAAVRSLSGIAGPVGILVNNAGILLRAPFQAITEQEWTATIATNLTAYFTTSQIVARGMIEAGSGCIVHISSTNDAVTSRDCTSYAVAKSGIAMLTKQMALELGPLGVRTNAVAPGMIETDINRRQLADSAFRTDALARIPLGRFAEAADVAQAVSFLASKNAQSINGATIRVDGGRTVT